MEERLCFVHFSQSAVTLTEVNCLELPLPTDYVILKFVLITLHAVDNVIRTSPVVTDAVVLVSAVVLMWRR